MHRMGLWSYATVKRYENWGEIAPNAQSPVTCQQSPRLAAPPPNSLCRNHCIPVPFHHHTKQSQSSTNRYANQYSESTYRNFCSVCLSVVSPALRSCQPRFKDVTWILGPYLAISCSQQCKMPHCFQKSCSKTKDLRQCRPALVCPDGAARAQVAIRPLSIGVDLPGRGSYTAQPCYVFL